MVDFVANTVDFVADVYGTKATRSISTKWTVRRNCCKYLKLREI